MTEPLWKPVTGIMMTSERISAYGGISFPRSVLESAAVSIRSGAVPLHVDHDLTRPVRTRNADAFVHTRSDGIHELRTSFEIDTEDLHLVGLRSGLSVMLTTPVERPVEYLEPTDPTFRISADHAWFSDEALLEAEVGLIAQGIRADSIDVQRAYQFNAVPDPQIYVEVAVNLLTGVAGSAIWAGLARLFRGRRTPVDGNASLPTTINLTLVNGGRSVKATVQTNDEDVAIRALESLDLLGEQIRADSAENASDSSRPSPSPVGPANIWNDQSRQWTPPK